MKPIAKPADIPPVRGIPMLVIAKDSMLLSLKVLVVAFAIVEILPSILSQLKEAISRYCKYANPAMNIPTTTAMSLTTFFSAYPSKRPPKNPPPTTAPIELILSIVISYLQYIQRY
jgi:hypothetical protein